MSMDSLLQDLRYGARLLARSPGFTAVAVLTLALGIGANSAIYSAVRGLVLKAPPLPAPERLVVLWTTGERQERVPVSLPDFLDWRRQTKSFAALSAYRGERLTLAAEGIDPQRVLAAQASADFFATLGMRPALGRSFLPAEDRPGHAGVVVLGHELWQRRFGADSGVLGRPITLDGKPYTIVGVLPRDLRLPSAGFSDLWLPLAAAGPELMSRGQHANTLVVGRLAPGVSERQARAEMAGIASRLARQYPDTNAGAGIGMAMLMEELVGEARPVLLVLWAAVALVLLVACANVTNLLLARAAARRRETAIRGALGAGRGRLVRQLLTESALLACLGGTAGLLVASWGIDVLRSLTKDPGRAELIALDGGVLAFTAALSLATGLLLGLAPAFAASAGDAGTPLRQAGGGAGPNRAHRANRANRVNLLVAAEVAFALLLAATAGLTLASFAKLTRVDPGFDPHGVLAVEVSPPAADYPEPARRQELYRRALERVAALPGVVATGLADPLPLGGTRHGTSIEVEDPPQPAPGESLSARYQMVSPGYFRALGIPLLRGRNLDERDMNEETRAAGEAPPASTAGSLLVDDALARRLWPGQDPVGKRLRISGQPWRTVVGVVGAIRADRLYLPAEPQMYLPYSWNVPGSMELVVKASGEPELLAASVRGELRALERALPLDRTRTLDELIDRSTDSRLYPTLMLGLFAAVALSLAALGVYGVTAYAVERRTGEIGIRGALGANRRDILRLVLAQGMRSAGLGLAVGLAGALALTRFLAGLLYGVSPTDLPVFTAVALLLGTTAVLASWLPARRAARLDPALALRCE